MNIPAELYFTKSHEWVRILPDRTVEIGLTDHAQNAMGDSVFVNLPKEGDNVEAGKAFADVESVKAVSDVYSPVTGKIIAINEKLLDEPEDINKDAYVTWMIRVALIDDLPVLLDAKQYEQVLLTEEA